MTISFDLFVTLLSLVDAYAVCRSLAQDFRIECLKLTPAERDAGLAEFGWHCYCRGQEYGQRVRMRGTPAEYARILAEELQRANVILERVAASSSPD